MACLLKAICRSGDSFLSYFHGVYWNTYNCTGRNHFKMGGRLYPQIENHETCSILQAHTVMAFALKTGIVLKCVLGHRLIFGFSDIAKQFSVFCFFFQLIPSGKTSTSDKEHGERKNRQNQGFFCAFGT